MSQGNNVVLYFYWYNFQVYRLLYIYIHAFQKVVSYISTLMVYLIEDWHTNTNTHLYVNVLFIYTYILLKSELPEDVKAANKILQKYVFE